MTEKHSHYDEAERLLSIAEDDAEVYDTLLSRHDLIGMARTHATLAVADHLGQLVELLAAWRAEIDSVPTPVGLVDADTAVAAVRRGMQRHALADDPARHTRLANNTR
ncbi:hypothetical protein [Amycolatopsis thermoflava]|uniref:hypothetical protein n=1 Tax=Amycolatopsis thermoflava TaxID=84480 RepID=UPI003F4A853D